MAEPSEWDAALLAEVREYYRSTLLEHGENARGMDWKDEASQRLRFDVILRYVERGRRVSILDVGCGNGELLAHCSREGFEVAYLGIDVCDEMVEACRRRFGESACRVGRAIDLADSGQTFDYVVASGTFNVRGSVDAATWRRHVHGSVRQMYGACRRATIFNVMSEQVDFRLPHLYYPRLGELGELATACGTRDFLIDHGYPLFEQTMVLWRPGTERS